MKKQQEEEMIRQRQIEYEAKKQAELDMRKKQEEERIRKKKREEEELERLLLDIGDGSDFLVEDIEQTNDDVNTIDTAEMNDKTPVEDLTPRTARPRVESCWWRTTVSSPKMSLTMFGKISQKRQKT